MFIQKNLTPYEISKHLVAMRNQYLQYQDWFETAELIYQEEFLRLCRCFIKLGRTKRNLMMELSREIAYLCNENESAILRFATRYEVNGFLGIRYIATMTFLRVFHEKKGLSVYEALFYNDCKKGVSHLYALQLDNLLSWTAQAQQRISKLSDDQKSLAKEMLNAFSHSIATMRLMGSFGNKAFKELHYIQQRYLEYVAPLLGEGIDILIDYFGDNPGKQWRFILFEGPHDLRTINLLCIQSLKEVINGAKPLSIDDTQCAMAYF